MSSRTNAPPPGRGSSARHSPSRDPSEDALSSSAPPTDDTPTIISRQAPQAVTPSDDSARSVRGRRLAHFELIEAIGVGGMAAVLRARDTQLDRIVALKILPPEMAIDAENVRRFHQEARSAAKLDHENIARVFYCGEDQRLHFIAFEFVEGENLRTIIERRGKLPVGEALHYMLQVTAGLAHAAQRGVVHRDIKPSNIIIGPTGRAKLVDMGLARSLVRKGEDDLTQSGVTLGTFDYISPEQALEPRDADTRSDIYSLGCTLYHMLTGRVPVPEGTAAKKLHHHQHVKPADPRDYTPGLPLAVVQVLDRMMAKQPMARYQSPEQLAQALFAAAQALGLAHGSEGGIAFDTPAPPSAGGRPLLWVGVAAVLVALLVTFTDTGGQNRPSGRSTSLPPRTETTRRPDSTPKEGGKGKTPDSRPVAPPVEASPAVVTVTPQTTRESLAALLARHKGAPRLEVVLAADLVLTPDRGDEKTPFGGLVIEARQIILRSEAGSRHKVELTYDGRVVPGEVFAALKLVCQKATVEDVAFKIGNAQTKVRMRALSLPSGTQHVINRCLFVQAGLKSGGEPGLLASLSLGATAEASLKECVFLGTEESGGQDAILCAGRFKADDCAFGPHAAAIRLGEGGEASLKHCSILLPSRRSALFEMSGHCTARLESSIVGRMAGEGEGAVLLRQAGEGAVFQGADNALYRLDGFWARGDAWKLAGWMAFHKLLTDDPDRGRDDSRLIPASPWRASPSRQRDALAEESVKDAFAAAADSRCLRKLGRSSTDLVGARTLLGASLVPAVFPETREPARRRLVVEKGPDDDTRNGVFGSLASAVLAARSGDSIVLRQDGELSAQPMSLNRKELANLTIRSARGFRPLVVLSETSEANAELFRVHGGRLRLEGLDFRLGGAGGAGDVRRTQAVVALVGDGDCLLKGCTVTMLRSEGATLAAATLAAPGGVMKVLGMPPARMRDKGPRLALEDCLVRGEGDLLSGRATRPAALEVKNSVVALSGSVFAAEFDGGDMAPPATQKLTLSLDRVTAYLAGPLARLKARKGAKGTVQTSCSVRSSVLLPANGFRALVQLEVPEGDTDEMPFKWSANGNAYGGYTSLMAQAGSDDVPMMAAEKLKKTVGDAEGVFEAKLARPITDKAFAEMNPKSFALAGEPKAGQGASLP